MGLGQLWNGIWFRRNKYIFENKTSSSKTVEAVALDNLEEFHQALDFQAGKQCREGVARVDHRWIASRRNMIKSNFDVVVDNKYQKIWIGVILRACEGEIMAIVCAQKS